MWKATLYSTRIIYQPTVTLGSPAVILRRCVLFKGFSHRAQGASHIKKNIVCQDAAAYYCDCNGKFSIAVISDGHGGSSHFRSNEGSEIAVRETVAAIKEFIGRENDYIKKIFPKESDETIKRVNRNKALKQLESNIIYRWNEAVRRHYAENSVTEDELERCGNKIFDKTERIYGATLVAAAMTKKYWFALQVGDGACVTIINEKTAESFIPDDDRLVFSFTTSLCDSDAIENFRHYFGEKMPMGIIVSSDGVSNSFKEGRFLNFNCSVLNLFVSKDNAAALEEVKALLPVISEKGSKDDVSIAGIYFENVNRHN